MITTKVTATVPKKHNSVWAGKGDVVTLDTSSGVVILKMTTGDFKGHVGGFDIDKVRFHVKRTES
jgi:hypothetical protein